MTTELISNAPLSQDFETDWFQLTLDKSQNFGRNAVASALQLVWKNVEGSPDGIVEIFTSTMPGFGARAVTCSINTINNSSDSEYIALLCPFSFMKLKFIRNSINGGYLSVFISYMEQ